MLGIGMDLIVNGQPLGWLLMLPGAPVSAVPGWLLAAAWRGSCRCHSARSPRAFRLDIGRRHLSDRGNAVYEWSREEQGQWSSRPNRVGRPDH